MTMLVIHIHCPQYYRHKAPEGNITFIEEYDYYFAKGTNLPVLWVLHFHSFGTDPPIDFHSKVSLSVGWLPSLY